MHGRNPDLKRDLLEDPNAVPHDSLIAVLKDEAPLFGRALGREDCERRATLGLIGLVDNDDGQPLRYPGGALRTLKSTQDAAKRGPRGHSNRKL